MILFLKQKKNIYNCLFYSFIYYLLQLQKKKIFIKIKQATNNNIIRRESSETHN